MFGIEFCTVRVLCHACGWFRNIGYTGVKDNIRAVINIQRSKDPRHILHGKVLEFSAEQPLEEISSKYSGYRDLQAEAHREGLYNVMAEFNPLVEGASCPRCKKEGDLCIDSIMNWVDRLSFRVPF